MGEAEQPPPVNLICGLMAGREEWLQAGRRKMEQAFGPVDAESEVSAGEASLCVFPLSVGSSTSGGGLWAR